MALISITLSDLWPTFQGHDNIQRPITRLIVSRVWSVQWFRSQWPWVTHRFQGHRDALDELCAQLTRDLFAIAKFLFTEIWRYINFQNGGRPPSWKCFTTIRDYPHSHCCWPQLPVKFDVNLIHRSEDIDIWIFRIFGLKCLFRPPK